MRIFKQLLSCVMVAILLLGCMPIGVFAEGEDVLPEGYTGIYNIEDLYIVRYNLSGKYMLMADIDLTEATAEGGEWDSGFGWTPIGESSTEPFTGVFDGNGHTIKGMSIRDTPLTYVGFFGYIKDATIQNLKLDSAVINDDSVSYVGTLAAYAVNSTITRVAVANLSMTASARYGSADKRFGGVIGVANNCAISECYVSGSIAMNTTRDAHSYIGGLVGFVSNSNISNSYNAAEISVNQNSDGYYRYSYVGGITGSSGNITSCVNIGAITSVGSGFYIGAINGREGTLSKCYYKKGTASTAKYNTADTQAMVIVFPAS